MRAIVNKSHRERGQGLTEYAIILSLVAVTAIITMAYFGGAIKAKMGALAGALSGQESSEVTNADQVAMEMAESAQEDASDINETMSLDGKVGDNGSGGRK